jgi:hypothetical protein
MSHGRNQNRKANGQRESYSLGTLAAARADKQQNSTHLHGILVPVEERLQHQN